MDKAYTINKIKQLLFFCVLLFLSARAHCQAQLVLNGAVVKIANNANFVLDNSSANALVRNSGYIVSEGENSKLKWNIGTTAGTYTIPFGYSATEFIPLTFTKTAGTGSGSFTFATYRTGSWQNSLNLPSAISNVNDASGNDNSEYVIDRFWMINAEGYTSKPDLSNLIFTYADAEHSAASNTITETNLRAQRWNSTSSEWSDMAPAGAVNTAANTVTVANVSAANFFSWWTLVDLSSPLPVEILDVNYKCENGIFKLYWSTASEINNHYFTLEKSADARNWHAIAKVEGKGNSNKIEHYEAIDSLVAEGTVYYRLKQTDFDGRFKYHALTAVNCSENESNIISVYPNPTKGPLTLNLGDQNNETTVEVINILGETVYSEKMVGSAEHTLNLGSLSNGIYFVKILNNFSGNAIRIVVEK